MDPKQSRAAATTTDDGDRLIRLTEVLRLCGLSRTQMYLQIGKADFPRPVKIGERAAAWSERAVQEWIASKIRQGCAAVRRTAQGA